MSTSCRSRIRGGGCERAVAPACPTDRPPSDAGARSSTTSRPSSSTSVPTICAPGAVSRSPCGRSSRRSASSVSCSAPSPSSGSAATPPSPTTSMSRCCRRCTAGRRRWPPGVKRSKPDTVVFTVQGDGDMVNEGLQEVLHTAARGETDHLLHAQQRGVRRDRRAHDRHHRARPADQEHPRRTRRRRPRLSDPAAATSSPSSTGPPSWPGARSTTPATSPGRRR